MMDKLKIGTRRSPLAMAQTAQFVDELCAFHGMPPRRVEIIGMSTKGDEIVERRLSEIGGKGLFTFELEQALLNGELDFAVHSLKDLPTKMPIGLTLGCVPQRENPHDIMVLASLSLEPPDVKAAQVLNYLPQATLIGTSSLRRMAQLKLQRADLETISLRGNIATRIKKLSANKPRHPRATLLAAAGLNRLRYAAKNFDHEIEKESGEKISYIPLPADIMLPAAGQGALGIQCREDDKKTLAFLGVLECIKTRAAITAERSYLETLEGSCRTPIAALAQIKEQEIFLKARLLAPDGSEFHEFYGTAPISEARALGKHAAKVAIKEKPHLLPHPEGS